MRWVRDRTGRFAQRPFWQPGELDVECERIVTEFLQECRGDVSFPISSDDLTVMVERDVSDLDTYADLSGEGADVEGVTDFYEGRAPRVRIDAQLARDSRRANRLRTTLTHEYGHVRFHGFLWNFAQSMVLFDQQAEPGRTASCRRQTVVDAPRADWMEWQAAYASGAFLMPVTQVAAAVARLQREAAYVAPVQDNTPAAERLVAAILEAFEVSQDAARVRLTKLGHLTSMAQPDHGLFDLSG